MNSGEAKSEESLLGIRDRIMWDDKNAEEWVDEASEMS